MGYAHAAPSLPDGIGNPRRGIVAGCNTSSPVEWWKVADANTLDYEVTIEDPKVFTQPWKIAYQIVRNGEKNFEFLEEACWEGVSVRDRLEAGRITRHPGRPVLTVTKSGEGVAMSRTGRRRSLDPSKSGITARLLLAAVVLVPATASAQSMPRTPDGKPDLSGIWQVVNTAAWNILPHPAESGVPAGLGVVDGNEIPYTPAAAAKQRDNYTNRAKLDPETRCWLPGVPRATYMGLPFQIVQTSSQVSMLYEYAHAVRNIFMNSPHPKGPIEWWMGDSRGRWEGDTLVVDVVHFNDQTWFDRAGNHHSEALHVVERYTPIDRDHMNYEVTIEDPKIFTRSWKMSMPLYRRLDKNMQLLDYECAAFDEAFQRGPVEPR